MTVHYQDDTVTLYHGDCLDVLRELPDASVHAVVTDPPYGIAFMGKEWDQFGEFGSTRKRGDYTRNKRRGTHDDALEAGRYDLSPSAMVNFQRWCEAWSRECLRVLKPGGYMLVFGGSRTWHRLASGIEDAGFEIRDSMAWLYGSGFPKSLDVSKAIDKAAGVEREVVSEGTPVKRMIPGADQNATGSWIKDNGRTFTPTVTSPATPDAETWAGWGTALKPAFEPIVVARKPFTGTVAANVLEHGTGAINIDACRVAHANAADLATSQAKNPGRADTITSDVYGAGRPQQSVNVDGRWPTNVVLDESQAEGLDAQTSVTRSRVGKPREGAAGDGWNMTASGAEYDDEGGASRFFPTFRYEAKAPTSERPREGDTSHPTVKPLDLMRWLVRLVTPPGGVVLEPFAGSGTTAEACVIEGFQCIAIERDETYLPLIVQRLSKPIQLGLDIGASA